MGGANAQPELQTYPMGRPGSELPPQGRTSRRAPPATRVFLAGRCLGIGHATHSSRNQVNRRRPCKRNQDHIMSCPTPTAVGMSRKTARPVAVATSTRSKMLSMPGAKSARTKAPSSTSTARTGRSRKRTATGTIHIHRRSDARVNLIPDLGTEPIPENRGRKSFL